MLNDLPQPAPTALERGKPPELPNLPKRIGVDNLLQTQLVMIVDQT